jgi:hypothetical protein
LDLFAHLAVPILLEFGRGTILLNRHVVHVNNPVHVETLLNAVADLNYRDPWNLFLQDVDDVESLDVLVRVLYYHYLRLSDQNPKEGHLLNQGRTALPVFWDELGIQDVPLDKREVLIQF